MIDNYISHYGKRLYGLCMHLCSNPAEADDLYQDTWMKVIENISKFDQSKDFEPWLTKICVNTFRNKLRRLARSPFWNHFANFEAKDQAMNAVPVTEINEYSALHEAIRYLPDKLRVTTILFYFEDMGLASTAQVLDIPLGTVKSRLSKSKALLREALQNETDIQL
ncbi:MAG: sigma-70 family RNA polymerase sigma factor [Dehalococcoidia bacterium]|nr:sigma-70 family RNA polymerase sigma factor [Dehalococcoidia bacterium]